jgi:uncharacterized membrane protein
MRRLVQHVAIAACAGALGMAFINAAGAQQAQAERGKYLVSIAGCNDCHTPGYFFGKPI